MLSNLLHKYYNHNHLNFAHFEAKCQTNVKKGKFAISVSWSALIQFMNLTTDKSNNCALSIS